MYLYAQILDRNMYRKKSVGVFDIHSALVFIDDITDIYQAKPMISFISFLCFQMAEFIWQVWPGGVFYHKHKFSFIRKNFHLCGWKIEQCNRLKIKILYTI